jgi:hypothetical protein
MCLELTPIIRAQMLSRYQCSHKDGAHVDYHFFDLSTGRFESAAFVIWKVSRAVSQARIVIADNMPTIFLFRSQVHLSETLRIVLSGILAI